MKFRVLFFIIISLLLPLDIEAEEVSLSLDEAIAIALRDNKDILLKIEDVNLARLKIIEAKSGLLPDITLNSVFGRTSGLYTKDLDTINTQVSLRQYLYQGGRTVNTIKYNGYQWEVAQALLDKTKLELIANVKKTFYTLALAEEFARLNKNILDNTKEHLMTLRERYQQGQASNLDILNIEAGLSNVEKAYQASLNQVEAAQALLRNFLSLDKDVQIRPVAEFTYEPMEIVYEEAFLEAMKSRPEIRQYFAQIEADKKYIEIAKGAARPSIYASWDYYSRSHSLNTTSRNWSDYSVIGITFSWPVFDGWETRAKVEEATLNLKETQLRKEKTLNDITLELKNAYLGLSDAIFKIKSTQVDMKRYQDNLYSIKKRYKDGIVSHLELDDAELAYKVSLFKHRQAIYDYIVAKMDFEKAVGGTI